MRKSVLAALTLLALPLSAQAAAISPGDALQRVLHTERENSAFLVRFPTLQGLDAALRNSCAANAPGKARGGGYCTCAGAVVMSAWRSNPAMLQRLSAYANAPDPDAALDLLKYQSPGLYAPLCTAARLAD